MKYLDGVVSVVKYYGILWTTAVGGILGANAVTMVAAFFSDENKASQIQPWPHYGWYAGSALFLIAAIMGKLRFVNGAASSESSHDSSKPNDKPEETEDSPKKDSGVPGFLFACGLGGGFLGLLFGCSLMVFVFSWAYSPFSSEQVASSVTIDRELTGANSLHQPVMKTDSPIAAYVCLSPALIGVAGGIIAGSVIVLKYRKTPADTVTSVPPAEPTRR